MGTHPDLTALVGTGNYSTIAIADEIAARGSSAKAFGVDADPDVLTLMREGKVAGIVAQNPYVMGYQTVEMLVAATKGESPAEKLVYTESVFVTPTTWMIRRSRRPSASTRSVLSKASSGEDRSAAPTDCPPAVHRDGRSLPARRANGPARALACRAIRCPRHLTSRFEAL